MARAEAAQRDGLRDLAETVFTTGALRHRLPHPENRQKCAACRIKAAARAALADKETDR